MRRAHLALLLLLAALLALAGCSHEEHRDAPPLVLLVTVDTLRADHLGFYGDAHAETPELDRLAGESLVFDTAFAPASFTVPSVTSILTGYYPEQNSVYSNEHVLPEVVPTLATFLARRGYGTGAVVSNFVLRGASGLGRAFDHYDDRLPEREVARGMPERDADETTTAALAMLDRLEREHAGHVFLWVHYQDPHGPYTPGPELRARFLPYEESLPDGKRELEPGTDHRGLGTLPNYQVIDDEREVAFYRAGYRGEIAATDRAIGRLLEGVRARAPWDRSVVVFAADHGEGLGERDYWFAHGEYLFEPLTHVPLVVKAPGLAPGRRDDLVGLIDVVPTLLPLVGLAPAADLPGRDLLAQPEPDRELYMASLLASSLPRIGLVRDGYTYVATQTGPGKTEEELRRIGAPERDLAAEEPERVADMRRRLTALRPGLRALGAERKQELTDSDRAAMRALGYGGEGRGAGGR